MVNSKKMRKSTVAIVLLSILLCLSMILTATGAWFTSKANGEGNAKIDFGKVEITSATASVTVQAGNKYLPGDKITGEVSFVNGSDVDIYYIYDVVAEAYSDATYTTKLAGGLITNNASSVVKATELAANEQAEKQTITFTLVNDKEDNTLNGKTVYLKVTIVVKAIQKANVGDAAAALEKLNSPTFGA